MLFLNFDRKKLLFFLIVVVNIVLIIFSGYFFIKPFYILTLIAGQHHNSKQSTSHSDLDWLYQSSYKLTFTFSNQIKYVLKEWQAIQNLSLPNQSLNSSELNPLLGNLKKKMADQYFVLVQELAQLKDLWSQTNWSSFLGNQHISDFIDHLKEENCQIWQRKLDNDQKTPSNEPHRFPDRYIPYAQNMCQNEIIKNYFFRYRMHIEINDLIKKYLGQSNVSDVHLTLIMKRIKCYEKVRFFFDPKYQKYHHDSNFLEVDDDYQLIIKIKKIPDYLLIRRLIRLVFNPKMKDFNDLDFKIVDQYFTALVDLVAHTKEILNLSI